MSTPYRADHIGSLLRPTSVLDARAAHVEGRIELDELRQTEDKAILDALTMQREVGLDVYTDGEYRRGTFQTDLSQWADGFMTQAPSMNWQGPDGGTVPGRVQFVSGKLRQNQRIAGHEAAFMKEHAPGPIKITLPTAAQIAGRSYKPGLSDRFYPTHADLLWEVTGFIRDEVNALVDDGVSYVQLDAPCYTDLCDPGPSQMFRDLSLDDAIAADNACVKDVKDRGTVLAIHLCRGNNRSRWLNEGGYDPIAEKLFGSLEVDAFLLEYDTDRAGGFEPLRFVPSGKTVVLGLVTTKEGRLEAQDGLLRRIEEASRYVPLDNLSLSPQCGFASVSAGNLLSYDDQRRKLELVVDTARRAWG